MERTRTASEAVLARAADIIDEQTQPITERWLQRLRTTVYSRRPELGEALRDAAPAMIGGIAEALRRGQSGQVEAPWTHPAREHARLRQSQGVSLGDLLQEFQILRQELRQALCPALERQTVSQVLLLEKAVDDALATLIGLFSSIYDAGRTHTGAEAGAQREASDILESITEAFLAVDREWRLTYVNREAEHLAGLKREDLLGRDLWTELPELVGSPFDAPLHRALAEQVPAQMEAYFPSQGQWIEARAYPSDGGLAVYYQDVTERKRLEDEREGLRAEAEAAQARLEAVLQQMPSGVVIAEAPSGRLVLGNEQMARIWRQPFQPLPGVEQYASYQGFHADGRPYHPEEWPLARSLRTGEVVHDEVLGFLRADGSRGTMSANSAPIRDRNGHIVAAVALFNDITERNEAYEKLRESEERFRRVFEEGPLGMVLVGLDFRLLVVNARFAQMLGYTQAELTTRSFPEITHPDDIAKDVDLAQRLQAGEIGLYSMEKRYITKQGSTFWARLSVSMVRTPEGKPQYYLSMIEDISQSKQAEEERERFLADLQAANERLTRTGVRLREATDDAQRRRAELEAVFNASPDLLFIMAADGTILDYRKGATTGIYLPPERFLGRRLQEVLPPAVARPHEEGIHQALQERTLVTFEYRLRVAERDEEFEARILPLDGDRALVIARNITDRKRAEADRERLQEETERRAAELDSAISSVADGLIMYDTQGRIVRMNAEAERQFGYGPTERALPMGERAALIEMAEGRPLQVEEIPGFRALQGETVRSETLSVRRPGRESIWVASSAAPIRGPNGQIVGAVATSTDVTALRQLQEQTAQLLEAERQAREQAEAAVRARDEFLSASAHELKTPITNLRGYAQVTMRRLQREETPDPERTRQALSTIDRQSDRLARLVGQLLDVASIEAGRLELHRQRTDLVPVVRQLVETVQAGARRHRLILQAPPSLEATVDPERVENVVANLLDNAVRYSPPDTRVEVDLTAPSPDTVQLAVRDFGPGIAPERRPQLFSRFYQAQTGRPFAGLGLGLFYSRNIVELHGGRIYAEFPPEGGSRFVVTLPVGMAGAAEEARPERAGARMIRDSDASGDA